MALFILADQPHEYSFRQSFPVAGPQSTGRQRMGHRPAQMLVSLVIEAMETCPGWVYPPEGYLWATRLPQFAPVHREDRIHFCISHDVRQLGSCLTIQSQNIDRASQNSTTLC